MPEVDVAIVGGGLAGSTAAAMLGRASVSCALVDPHPVYPFDFRCEKLDGSQVAVLRKTGLERAVFAAATLDDEVSIMRLGRIVERRKFEQYDILYDTLVNTMRSQIPPEVKFFHAKATEVSTTADRQTVTLSTGETLSARLIVIANGLNIGLRHQLGMTRRIISECHSISIGFDMMPRGRPTFDFVALTYFPVHVDDRMAYLALFPIGETMRANLFVYRDMNDPWLRDMRKRPEETLTASMPGLRDAIGDFAVSGDVRIRPVDLYVTDDHRQPGVVLVGDAYATSCPAAGTGANKVFTDVERLCNIHIPQWLASDGMDVEKIAAFYDDPVKMACDAASQNKAFYLKALSTDGSLSWQLRRWARSAARSGIAAWRRASAPRIPGHQPLPAN
jgi:2-polyprenyl-6-methoxyphenol hydroxylase-like FAD-dependent oxidoreductase